MPQQNRPAPITAADTKLQTPVEEPHSTFEKIIHDNPGKMDVIRKLIDAEAGLRFTGAEEVRAIDQWRIGIAVSTALGEFRSRMAVGGALVRSDPEAAARLVISQAYVDALAQGGVSA